MNVLLKPAEDPRKDVAYTYERQRLLLVKVRRLLADIEKARQRLVEKTAVLTITIGTLETESKAYLLEDREELARQKLRRQQLTIIERQMIQTRINELGQEEQRLLPIKQRLVAQIEAYLARREALQARYSSAESQVKLSKELQTIFRDLDRTDYGVELAEERTAKMEAHASLLDQNIEQSLWLNTAENITTTTDLDQMVEASLVRLRRGSA